MGGINIAHVWTTGHSLVKTRENVTWHGPADNLNGIRLFRCVHPLDHEKKLRHTTPPSLICKLELNHSEWERSYFNPALPIVKLDQGGFPKGGPSEKLKEHWLSQAPTPMAFGYHAARVPKKAAEKGETDTKSAHRQENETGVLQIDTKP
jgi:hypothetical protein